MKIHIIGGPGSGKTFLAEKLSKELGVKHYDLDDIQWDNQSDSYGVKRAPNERDGLLADVLSNKDWIVEGVYYAWCQQCFADADKIYLPFANGTFQEPVRTLRLLRFIEDGVNGSRSVGLIQYAALVTYRTTALDYHNSLIGFHLQHDL